MATLVSRQYGDKRHWVYSARIHREGADMTDIAVKLTTFQALYAQD